LNSRFTNIRIEYLGIPVHTYVSIMDNGAAVPRGRHDNGAKRR
jgi:hypothetical protein